MVTGVGAILAGWVVGLAEVLTGLMRRIGPIGRIGKATGENRCKWRTGETPVPQLGSWATGFSKAKAGAPHGRDARATVGSDFGGEGLGGGAFEFVGKAFESEAKDDAECFEGDGEREF